MDDAFRPLKDDERREAAETGWRTGLPTAADDFEPLPMLDGAEPPDRHPRLGRHARRWAYRDVGGQLIGYVCRFEMPSGKEVRPLRYGRCRGRDGWHWKGWGEGRPLYNLPALLARSDAPVLVVEGEKAADAAAELLPEYVVVAAMNGALSAGKTDWTPLAGRDVTVWPDNDDAGHRFTEDVARLIRDAGAHEVRVVAPPDELPGGWDLADPPPAGWNGETARALLAEASLWQPGAERHGRFLFRREREGRQPPGVYHEVEDKDGNREWRWLCSPLEVVARLRNDRNQAWGRLLRVTDPEGHAHEWAMPATDLAGDGTAFREKLLYRGLVLASGRAARELLAEYVQTCRPSAWARCVDRVGWHGRTFVLPDCAFGGRGERVILQTSGAPPAYTVAGSLDGWRAEIAARAVGNSRFVFAIALAFAGPLVHLVGEESGGVHFVGASSIGKTVLLRCAGSVWGAELGSWRTTDNGAEAAAVGACDALLTLDEIGQAPARVVSELAYMLGNQRGKTRMRNPVTGGSTPTWRVLFASTGELGLAAKLVEDNRTPMAGQRVRVLEVPADAGKGRGVFDDLHGFKDGAGFAERLRLAAHEQRGHAVRAFLERLTRDDESVAATVREARERFVEERCPPGADGQVKRAAGRFGLVAAAGELATAFGIVPWEQGAAEDAAGRCFEDWLDRRGGAGAAETTAGLGVVRAFLEAHGMSRFEPAWAENRQENGAARHDVRVGNRVGFRRPVTIGEGSASAWEYLVLPEAWRNEVCRGLDPAAVARSLKEHGWLKPGDGRNLTRQERVPGQGKLRAYVIEAGFMGAEPNAEGVSHADG